MQFPIVRMVTAAFVLGACVASAAEERTRSDLAHKVSTKLPDGWQLSTTEHHWIVRREKPVTFYHNISLPSFESEEAFEAYVASVGYLKEFMIVLRFGPQVTPMQFEQWQADNRRAGESYDGLVAGVRDISHKFDQYLPKNAEEEKRVAQFKAAAAKIKHHRLPDFFHGRYSVYVETTQSWSESMYDESVAKECHRVRKLATAKFTPYIAQDEADGE